MATSPHRTTFAGSLDSELVRRNREICQVRVQLRESEVQVNSWKSRHAELLSRVHDLDGEVASLRRGLEEQLAGLAPRAQGAGAGADGDAEALRAELAESRALVEGLQNQLVDETDALIGRQEATEAAAEARARSLEKQLENERKAFTSKRERMEANTKERIGHLEMKLKLERQCWDSERATLEARVEGQTGVNRDELVAVVTKCTKLEEELVASAEATCAELRQQFAQERACFSEQQSLLEESVARALHAAQFAEARQQVATSEREEALVDLRMANCELRAERTAAAESAATLLAEVAARSAEEGQLMQLQAQVQHLHSDNEALQAQSTSLRRQVQELTYTLTATAQESQTARTEANAQIALLRRQVEEARNARTVTMNAMVKQWCIEGQSQMRSPVQSFVPRSIGGA